MTESDLIDGGWDSELADRLAHWRAGRSNDHDIAELAALLRRDPNAIDQVLASSALANALRHAPAHRQRQGSSWAPLLAAALLLVLVGGGWWALSRSTPSPLRPAEYVALVAGDGNGVGSEFRFEHNGAELSIAERARFTGRAGTHVRITALEPTIELDLLAGHLTTSATDTASEADALHIHTPAGTVETLGTRFIVELLPEESAMSTRPFLVTVLSGAVLVSGAWGQRELAAADSDGAQRFPPAEERPEPEQVPHLSNLDRRLTIDMRGVPLLDAIAWLADLSGTNLAMAQQDIARAATPPVVLEADNIEVGRALRIIAWQAGLEIGYTNKAWLLTDPKNAPSRRAIYDPGDLDLAATHTDGLAAAVHRLLKPVIDDHPAPVTISVFKGRLVLEAPDHVHWFITDLLNLARNLDAGTAGDLPLIAPRFGPPSPEMEATLARGIAFTWQDMPIGSVANWLRQNTDITIVVHPTVLEDPDIPPVTLSGSMSIANTLAWVEAATGLAIFTSGDEVLIGPEGPMRFQPFRLSPAEADNPELIATIDKQIEAADEPAWAVRLGRVLLVKETVAADARQILAELRLVSSQD